MNLWNSPAGNIVYLFSNIKKSGTFVNLKEIIFANISNTLQDGVSLLLDLLGKTYMCVF